MSIQRLVVDKRARNLGIEKKIKLSLIFLLHLTDNNKFHTPQLLHS